MSSAPAFVLDPDDYPSAVTREIPGLGACRLDDLNMAEAMRLFAVDRPHYLDYRRWASDFLSTSLAQPRLNLSDVDALSDLTRARMRVAAAEANGCGSAYRSLARSHLSPDERLFAAYYSTMREHFSKLAMIGTDYAAQVTAGLVRSAGAALRPLVAPAVRQLAWTQDSLSTMLRRVLRPLSRVDRLSRPPVWLPPRVQIPQRSLEGMVSTALRNRMDDIVRIVVAHREPLRASLVFYEALRGLSRYAERYERLWEVRERVQLFSEGPLGYLIEPLRLGVALELIDLIEEAGEEALVDLLERAARDEQVVARLRAAIREAPLLSESKRARLDHALGHVLAGEFLFALDPLISVVEGLFWFAAEDRELIDDRDRFTSASGLSGIPARGLEKLLGPLGVTDVFHAFLVRRPYGGRGHPFRHGRADEGERKQVLFLLVALAGWFETFAGVPARLWLLGALERELSSGTLVGATLTALDASPPETPQISPYFETSPIDEHLHR